jgi:hypothetical protein
MVLIPSVSSIIQNLPTGAKEAFFSATNCWPVNGTLPFDTWSGAIRLRIDTVMSVGPIKIIDGVECVPTLSNNGVLSGWRPFKIVVSEAIEKNINTVGIRNWFKPHEHWVAPEDLGLYWRAAKSWVDPQIDKIFETYPHHLPHIREQIKISIWKGVPD